MFKIALFTPKGCSQSASDIITPGHWALIQSLNHLSFLGSIQPVCDNYMRFSA